MLLRPELSAKNSNHVAVLPSMRTDRIGNARNAQIH